MESRTGTIARTFDHVCDVLTRLGYLTADGAEVTDAGRLLRRIYAETDLLVAECLRQDAWRTLDAPGLAAVVSALVHESRRDELGQAERLPRGTEEAMAATVRLWSHLTDLEEAHHVPLTREPDTGLTWAVHRWARGHRLDEVLRDADLSAGDFVRRCKQLVDLLDQIAGAAGDDPLRAVAREALESVRRGVVAYSSVA